MSRISFNNFGVLAAAGCTMRVAALAEKPIIADVVSKLELGRNDDLLEVGCGPGGLLLPLSRLVRSAVGLDHTLSIAVLRARRGAGKLQLIEGNFLDAPVHDSFSKILIYSVIHYLSDRREVFRFLDKAVDLLRPGGLLLVGDIPNIDKKDRFQRTRTSREVGKAWASVTAEYKQAEPDGLQKDGELVSIGDRQVLSILNRYRRRGHEAFVLPQSGGLGLCFTREDILVRKQWP